MTKEEFEVLQLDLQQSGKSVKDYLHDVGVNYSTYNYWRKKMIEKESPKPELAPISFTQPSDPVSPVTNEVTPKMLHGGYMFADN
jgi:putative transposase